MGLFGGVFDTRSGLTFEASGIAFNQALYSGYAELFEQRSDAWLDADWDFVDGELFNHKARTAKEEDGRTGDVEACRAAFEQAMADVESQANYALTDIDYSMRWTPAAGQERRDA